MTCELCQRDVDRLTVHHLIPRQKTKQKKADIGPTSKICSACHKQIHTLFNKTRLAQELNTLEKLKSEPEMQKFLSWVQKQDTHKHVRVHRQRARP